MSAIVEIKGLTKRYGDLYALKNLDLDIEQGSIFGYIGPNGAGKTTTMTILATLLRPTSGQAMVCGIDVVKNPSSVRPNIGFMPDFFGVYDDMKTWEYLDFFARAYGIEKMKRLGLISDLLELVGLSEKTDAYIENLSRGMKQRLGLSRCLINDPDLLILDEPSSGLDPRARIEIREILKELKSMGKTMIISSHILPELSEMCSHIGIIERGNLIASGEVKEITDKLSQVNEIEIKILGDGLEHVLESLPEITGVKILDDSTYSVQFNGGPDEEHTILNHLIAKKIKVYSFARKSDNLEDIFMKITKGAVQ